MTYTFNTSFGGNVIMAPCGVSLMEEIAAHPRFSKLTNLGQIGNTEHRKQGTASDHNPFVRHGGKWYVRAADFGGPRALLLELRDFLFDLYKAHDPRMWPYGYLKGPDSDINNWTPHGEPDGWHVDTGDEGHLHVSFNQANGYAPSINGWVPALDSTKPWGLTTIERNPLMSDKLDPTVVGQIKSCVQQELTEFFGASFMSSDVDDNHKPDKAKHSLSAIVRDEVADVAHIIVTSAEFKKAVAEAVSEGVPLATVKAGGK